MAFNFKAIADAIAARFDAVVPPTGAPDVVLITAELPGTIVQEPTILVFPPSASFEYAASARTMTAVFPVRFYIVQIRDNVRNSTLILNWLSTLYDQLDAQVHLGQSANGVNYGIVSELRAGSMTYAGTEYGGIEFEVTVSAWEHVTAVG